MAKSIKEFKKEIYRVFSKLPEGKYLWGMLKSRGGCIIIGWNLITVASEGERRAVMTIKGDAEAGLTVRAKARANGAGWRHVATNIDGRKVWGSDCGHHFAFTVDDDAKLTDELCWQGEQHLEKIGAKNPIMTRH
jgi:hypothetical protein